MGIKRLIRILGALLIFVVLLLALQICLDSDQDQNRLQGEEIENVDADGNQRN